MPKVSVIVPTYNNALVVLDAIESILQQSFQDFEILLINDGSTDNTMQVLEPCLSSIELIDQENQGPAAARNAGVRRASGDYLVFLDADDRLLPEKLATQVDFLDRNPQVDVVYSNGIYTTYHPDGTVDKQLFSEIGFLRKDLSTPNVSLKILAIQNAFPLHAAMVRREIVLDTGGFDENLPALEDWEFWYRVAERANFAYMERILVEYRNLPTGRSSDKTSYRLAFQTISERIAGSDSFHGLPEKIRSDFYFCWGLTELQFEDVQSARCMFRKALTYDRSHLLALIALGLSRFMGTHTLIFYHLKRKIWGAR
jgi:glycosyltransferase involved in cell wall biosynthesis